MISNNAVYCLLNEDGQLIFVTDDAVYASQIGAVPCEVARPEFHVKPYHKVNIDDPIDLASAIISYYRAVVSGCGTLDIHKMLNAALQEWSRHDR